MSAVTLPQHVDINALKAVFEKTLPDLSAHPSNTVEAFMTSTLRWVIDWAQSKDGLTGFTTSTPFAIIEPGLPPQDPAWKRQRFFREQGHKNLLEHSCLVVTDPQMTLAHVLQIKASDLEELGDAIEAAGMTAWPAILVDPVNRLLVRCPNGIAKPRISMHLEDNFVKSATRETLDEMLNKFDEDYTRHPEGFATIWCDIKERIVYRQAEQMVQNHLFLFLQTRVLASHLILREHQLPVGRADIAIYDPFTQKWVCVLELKVFRDKGLPRQLSGKIKPPIYTEDKMRYYAWCAVGQAARYKSSMACALAFLCCFDAREKEPKFPTVEARAKAEGIEYRQYRMHTKSGANDALASA